MKRPTNGVTVGAQFRFAIFSINGKTNYLNLIKFDLALLLGYNICVFYIGERVVVALDFCKLDWDGCISIFSAELDDLPIGSARVFPCLSDRWHHASVLLGHPIGRCDHCIKRASIGLRRFGLLV